MPIANAEKAKLLLLENVNDSAVELLRSSGFSTIERQPKALEGDALRAALKGVSLLGIRSRTALTQFTSVSSDITRGFAPRTSRARSYRKSWLCCIGVACAGT